MSHYSQSYEHDAKIQAQERAKELKKLRESVKKLRNAVDNNLHSREVPARFLHNLEDFENWLSANS